MVNKLSKISFIVFVELEVLVDRLLLDGDFVFNLVINLVVHSPARAFLHKRLLLLCQLICNLSFDFMIRVGVPLTFIRHLLNNLDVFVVESSLSCL